MTNTDTAQQITSAEFTNKDNFNTVYNTFRGDFLEAHGLDRNKKGVRIATGAFALQAQFGDKWIITTRDSKDEIGRASCRERVEASAGGGASETQRAASS